jgi:hypothetical protein
MKVACLIAVLPLVLLMLAGSGDEDDTGDSASGADGREVTAGGKNPTGGVMHA